MARFHKNLAIRKAGDLKMIFSRHRVLAFMVCTLVYLSSPLYAIAPSPIKSHNGMVVSEHHLASQVGAAILGEGGNAIDAAVAVGYALAVTQPCCGNIGGGGFMLIHLANGQNIFINFREKAPLAANPNMYLDKQGNVIPDKSLFGYASVGVPGTVMGLNAALKKYGTFSREKVMAPAIQLAKNGYVLTDADMKRLSELVPFFSTQPNIKKIFSMNGKPLESGQRLVQTDLGNTLTLISQKGSDVFYRGILAEKIVGASRLHDGYLTMKDFAQYTVQELIPIQCTYRNYTVITAPPPSGGGVTLCEMLGILEGYDLKTLGYHSAQSAHYMIESMRYAFADRNNKLGDPDFVKNPVNELISREYTAKLRDEIQPYAVTPSSELPYSPRFLENTNTTHYSVADAAGNLVAVTYTLNNLYGSKMIASDTGFFLNDEMDDFTVKMHTKNQFGLIQGKVNQIEPGKRPLSSMTPTILLKDNKPVLVLGSPGGSRIITAVLQTIVNFVDYGMDIQAAVDEPRFHHQWLPDYVDMEKYTFSNDTLEKMSAMGYRFRIREPWSVVEAISIDNGTFFGANDNREAAGKAVSPTL